MKDGLPVITIDGAEYVTAVDLAAARGKDVRTIYVAASAGRIKTVKQMGRVVIPFGDARNWLPGTKTGRPRKSPAPDSAPAKEGGGDG